jgi:hypothetical protein
MNVKGTVTLNIKSPEGEDSLVKLIFENDYHGISEEEACSQLLEDVHTVFDSFGSAVHLSAFEINSIDDMPFNGTFSDSVE